MNAWFRLEDHGSRIREVGALNPLRYKLADSVCFPNQEPLNSEAYCSGSHVVKGQPNEVRQLHSEV